MHPMHPMQPYINLYIFLIQVCASMHPMHPMQMIKLLFNSNGLISCLVSYSMIHKHVVHWSGKIKTMKIWLMDNRDNDNTWNNNNNKDLGTYNVIWMVINMNDPSIKTIKPWIISYWITNDTKTGCNTKNLRLCNRGCITVKLEKYEIF